MDRFENGGREKVTKGIVLAVDSGRQLSPMTQVVSRHLMPVYDKPMIYYPLSTLMLAGIQEILIVTSERDMVSFMELLGNGSRLRMTLSYASVPENGGMGSILLAAERFIGNDRVCLISGDSIFYGSVDFLREALRSDDGAIIFACSVKHSEPYSIIEFGKTGKVLNLEEESNPQRGNYAAARLYVYDNKVVDIVKSLESSSQSNLTLTDINREYLRRGELRVCRLDRSVVWVETGTERSLLEASNFIATMEHRRGRKIGCIEEAAFRTGFIDIERLERLIRDLPQSSYRNYLEQVARTAPGKLQERIGSYFPEGISHPVGIVR